LRIGRGAGPGPTFVVGRVVGRSRSRPAPDVGGTIVAGAYFMVLGYLIVYGTLAGSERAEVSPARA
jgi:hypothetical protein